MCAARRVGSNAGKWSGVNPQGVKKLLVASSGADGGAPGSSGADDRDDLEVDIRSGTRGGVDRGPVDFMSASGSSPDAAAATPYGSRSCSEGRNPSAHVFGDEVEEERRSCSSMTLSKLMSPWPSGRSCRNCGSGDERKSARSRPTSPIVSSRRRRGPQPIPPRVGDGPGRVDGLRSAARGRRADADAGVAPLQPLVAVGIAQRGGCHRGDRGEREEAGGLRRAVAAHGNLPVRRLDASERAVCTGRAGRVNLFFSIVAYKVLVFVARSGRRAPDLCFSCDK